MHHYYDISKSSKSIWNHNGAMASLYRINQEAYKSIDELYDKYHPDLPRDEKIAIGREIIGLKVKLRELQYEHIELTKQLNAAIRFILVIKLTLKLRKNISHKN